MNPYSGEDFFGFFAVLITRIAAFCTGQPVTRLASDEIQCLVLLFLGVSLAFLGAFLVLRQMTMVANALSHTLLLGIVGAFFIWHSLFGFSSLDVPFTSMKLLWVAALLTGTFTVLLTEVLTKHFRVQEDASIGLVFTTLFALGILFVTLFTRNMHLGMEALMGNIDALHIEDVKMAAVFSFFVITLSCCFFRGLFVSTFDPIFAGSIGFPVKLLGYLLMFLTAGAAIAAFRAIGVLLFLSFLVGPVLWARLYTHSLNKLIFYSMGISVICSICSVALSRHILTVYSFPLSTAGIASTLLFLFYLIALALRTIALRKFSRA